MPSLTPYTLTFRGGLRVGTRGVNLEEAGLPLPSDTLFAALVDALRRAGGDVDVFLNAYAQDPPFLLSSAFPYAGQVRFFPMPADPTRLFSPAFLAGNGGGGAPVSLKAIKRIGFLSQRLLERALNGQRLDAFLFPAGETDEPRPDGGAALQGGELWLTVEEIEHLPADMRRPAGKRHALRALKVWSKDPVPRVTVDRVNQASAIYHSGRITFGADCGLWFGVSWRRADPAAADLLARALAVLEGDGLGGERSSGYGAFHAQAGQSFDLPDAAPGGLAYLLSRYHPRPQDVSGLTSPGAAYRLTSVGGWLRSPDGPAQRRKRVHLLAEGSLVALPHLPAGDLADVTPDYDNPAGQLPHRVYRCGLALAASWR